MPNETEPSATPSPVLSARSVHTASFAEILRTEGISLWVTTYQAGKLVIIRANEQGVNTHFINFRKPMGLALHCNRLALGTGIQIWEYFNSPELARKLEPAGTHDACFIPVSASVTAEVLIHEMAYCEEELWFVNTRFSCLCTRSHDSNFEPRWRPRFISGLAPQDRCHLNGLGVMNEKVKYVTALGETDTPGGWRTNKRDGGILIDVVSDEILARKLSMPHSPRWYGGKLWLLESGTGTMGTVDPNTGRYEPIVTFPGFTRGVDFRGRWAFVGLSQVRETATFSGLPLTELEIERSCGVWAVDLVTGRIAGFVRFLDQVQEIFAVGVHSTARWPMLIHEHETHLNDSFILSPSTLNQLDPRLFGGGPPPPSQSD